MKSENYYVGFDIGTDSVGYAVTNEQYELCKYKGEPMWGVTLFDEAQLAVERRNFRVARRRLDRRQQRVKLLMELFAEEIGKFDKTFFIRIKESYIYPESVEDKVRLFNTYDKQKDYVSKYPTIHHLIKDLMDSKEPHDIRLVYIACAWLVVHRGHFLSEVNKENIDAVTDFNSVYENLVLFLKRDGKGLPWDEKISSDKIAEVLKSRLGVSKKSKLLLSVLFENGKVPKIDGETIEYNYDVVAKLLCGGQDSLKKLFGKDEYDELDEKSVALNMDDEKLVNIMQAIDEEDAEFIRVLKAVYDWSVLVDVLKGKKTVSEAKVAAYEQHCADLKILKSIIAKYLPEKYNEVFRSNKQPNNYVAYVGKNQTSNENIKVKKIKKEDFCKYIASLLKSIKPEGDDADKISEILSRLEISDFMPKQVDGDNRVIPYQLYWYELNKILENAKGYISFLQEQELGISGAEKILSVFEFRVPYFVGPLKENHSNTKCINHWMVRKAEGRILPWNFENVVDLEASENAFIARMTNSCTYLPGEDVLPKNSLVYCAFEVLNEINNIKVNGNEIPVRTKQEIYNNIFMQHSKVSPKRIKDYLIANNLANESDIVSGLDITIKSSLKPYLQFKNLVNSGKLTYSDVEAIINRATYSEDKTRFKVWLRGKYPNLPEAEIKYVSGLKIKEFGRLSKKLLCGIEGVNKKTGETFSIIRAMWETNNNFMQLCSDNFTFADEIDKLAKEYYGVNRISISERLDEMYVSNAVKRPIIRTLDILKDIVKVQKSAPKTIFIEMARGSTENQKGKRTVTRLKQIQDLYAKVKDEDVRVLSKQLEALGESAHNKLQSDKLFLYFIQMGKCLYTGKPISIESVISGDGTYNIEHIYPRSFVKDDSIINNKILVDSKVNGEKSDSYPIDYSIQEKMSGYWAYLHRIGLLSDEKYKRLTRKSRFTDEEKFEFINRQLVETRQSTKAVAVLLKELYPETEIVYVKAGLVSDFRQKFDLLKSRAVNDLHHAKDAYLNVVVGNVWYHKFSRQFWRAEGDNNAKAEIVFTRPVISHGKNIWNGVTDKDKVVRIARKNTAHLTKYAFCRKGGFFDQMPLSAAEGLVPRKQGMPTNIYGGYNKTTASFFVLVKYTIAKKQDVMVMPVELLYAKDFINDSDFAKDYAIKTIGSILNKEVAAIEFLLNKRIIKINTMLSLDGFRVCISGKDSGGVNISVCAMQSFMAGAENEKYIKKIESFADKMKKNSNIEWSEQYDGISVQKNNELFGYYIDKLSKFPYNKRPGNPVAKLVKEMEVFCQLPVKDQVTVLLQIQSLFGRGYTANLERLNGQKTIGSSRLSSSISNWKKNYTDVRIVDQSASGLFEKLSENLLDLI